MATAYGTKGNDLIDASDGVTNGADQIYGYEGHDTIYGLGGADHIFGHDGNDIILAGSGNDTLKGGGGADDLDGGAGTDEANYSDSLSAVTVILHDGLTSGTGTGGTAEGDTLTSIEDVTGTGSADTLWGNDSANVLHGCGGNDSLKGFGGNDTLFGEAGHDTLDGGTGADMMFGGTGNDTYVVDYWHDWVAESGGQGIDVVRTSVDWIMTYGADIEMLETTNAAGTEPLSLRGNASGQQIIGNDGDNTIDGSGGADHMVGRGGDDSYVVYDTNDTVAESGGQGHDEVTTIVSWTLTAGADVELLQALEGQTVLNLTGNSSGNEVRGNSGANVINGRGGNDELVGLGGTDAFRFDTALDATSNVDVLSDFNVEDVIHLDNAVFAAFATGPLAAERFVVGAAAQDASDNIIYNDVTGALLYDSDGNGPAAAIQFAQLNPGLGVTHQDFIVV